MSEIHSLVHRLPEKNRQMLHLLMNHLAKYVYDWCVFSLLFPFPPKVNSGGKVPLCVCGVESYLVGNWKPVCERSEG